MPGSAPGTGCDVRRRVVRALALAWMLPAGAARAGAAPSVEHVRLSEAARRLQAGGYVLMMRHAQTEPGVGDPPGFRLDDCATQRQLSAAGRAQAARVGATMRDAGIVLSDVLSSAWCRCQDTARLAFGRYRVWTPLNSFFADPASAARTTQEVLALAARHRDTNLMLVTHQVNISAAFGVSTAPSEVVAGRWRDGRWVEAFRFVPASD